MSNSEPVAVRQLAEEDISPVKALLELFSDAFEDPETYSAAPPGTEYLARLLGEGNVIVLAAFSGEAVAGGLVAYELPKLEQERSEIYIYDLAVAPEHRRRGVATALIECIKDIARQRGAWVVYVQADLGDEPAIALYTKMGVREDVLHFDIAPE